MRISDNHWLKLKPIAHRGLWGNGVTENSLSAYKLATQNGFPIEIDVYLTTDRHLVCFHDKTLDRMTGKKGLIFEKSLTELNELSISSAGEKIPTLEQVLDLARGKSPLLIEIKDQKDKSVVDELVAILKKYDGEFAVQSFNPFYLMRLKKLAPEFLRGVLATEYAEDQGAVTRWVLKHMPFNFIIKPDFISYSFTGFPVKKRKAKNKALLAWTLTDEQSAKKVKNYCDNIIFEGFLP